MNTCSVAAHSGGQLLVLGLAALALVAGRMRQRRRGQRTAAIAKPALPAQAGLDRNRLRYRLMPSYADLKNGDAPYVAPAAKAEEPEAIVAQLVSRNPELAAALRATALRVASAKGAITSDDVREALDDTTRRQLDASPKIMAAAWHPRRQWAKTGVYLPSRTPSQNKRPVAQWRLRGHAA